MSLQKNGIEEAKGAVRWALASALLFLLAFAPVTAAQETLETTGKLRIEGSFFYGVGIEKIDVGETTEDEAITISAGGGGGGTITFGYSFSKELEGDVGAGFQRATLSKDVENADGNFDRILLLVTLKYKIPATSTGQVKIGAGGGYYGSGELDVDASQVPGGAHNVYEYDDAFGFHITGEYEGFFSARKWSWILGIKYYNVKYDVNSLTSNGISVQPNQIPKEGRELDGSGVDLTFAMARYF